MTTTKRTFGIIAITTLVLMVATTVGSAINQADARVDQRNVGNQVGSAQRSDTVQTGSLANVNVGNANVQLNIPAQVCAICG